MNEALNVTTAAFGGLREVTTAPLWQYDYGQILQITGLDLPQAFEVHFSNSKKSGETVTQIGTDSQVTIPDMYLTSGADIYCFIFLHDGLTDGETEYVIKIPVRERPEPSDIEPTPEQQDVITQAIAALNVAVEQSETNVTHYPCIIDGYWHVWDAQAEEFVSTGVEAQGEKGDGGLAIFFSVPNKAIPTDANRKIVEDQSINFGVYAFKGGELIDPENVTASAFTFQSGQYNGAINAVVTHSTSERPQWHVSYTLRTSANITLRADSGTQTVNVTVDGVVHKVYFPWSAAKQGVQGEKGDPGEGAVNVFLRDPVTLIPTDSDGYHANQQIVGTYVYAFKDGEPCALTSVTATPVSILLDSTHIQAVDAVITVSGTSALVKYTLPAGTGLRNDRQIPTITAVVDGETHTATMCIASAKQGETGATPDLTIGTVETLPAGSQATASITGTEEEPVLNLGIPKGDAGDDYVLTEQDKEEIAGIVLESDTLQSELDDKADVIIRSVEGSLAHFEDGADNMPLKSMIAYFEPVREGSGDPAPDNVRPITGWTGLKISQTNENLIRPDDPLTPSANYIARSAKRLIIYDATEQGFRLDPNATGGINYANHAKTYVIGSGDWNLAHLFVAPKDGTYNLYAEVKNAGADYGLRIYTQHNGVNTRLRDFPGGSTWQSYTLPITVQKGDAIRIYVYGDVYFRNIQLTLDSATTYIQGVTIDIPITFPSSAGTVYGGTLDVTNGTLTVLWESVNLGSLTWVQLSDSVGTYYRTSASFIKRIPSGHISTMKCSHYPTVSSGHVVDKSIARSTGNGINYIYLRDFTYTTLDDFVAAMDGVQLCYEVVTPQTYQLTPVEIRTLKGVNNIWTNAGDVSLEYRADTKLYIDGKTIDWSKMIAPVEVTYKATKAYAKDSLLIVEGQLYKASAAIANGATLTVGTNITATTLAEVIAAL